MTIDLISINDIHGPFCQPRAKDLGQGMNQIRPPAPTGADITPEAR